MLRHSDDRREEESQRCERLANTADIFRVSGMNHSETKTHPPSSVCMQRSDINHKPVSHIASDDSLIGLIHLLDWDHLNVAHNVVFPAEIEHLLRLCDAANGRAGQAAPPQDKGE